MRRLHDEHHGTKACNDADSCPTLRTGVRGISLTAPLDAQARTEVQIGLLPRLQPHFAGALYRDTVEVLAHLSLSRLSCKCIQGLANRELWHKRWRLRCLLASEARQA